MKKIYAIAAALVAGAMSTGALAAVDIDFAGNALPAGWSVGQEADYTVADGHLAVKMAPNADATSYRADLMFAVGEEIEPLSVDPADDVIFAVKFIGSRPSGNMTLEFKADDGTWYNKQWKNHGDGDVVTRNGNKIHYYTLSKDETFQTPVSIVNLNIKIADCKAEPFEYTIDWIRTYPSLEALEADKDVADDGAADMDEYVVPAVVNVTTGVEYSNLTAALDAAAADDVIELNEDAQIDARYSIKQNITIQSAEGHAYKINRKNRGAIMFLMPTGSDENRYVVNFKNVVIADLSEEGTTPMFEINNYVTVNFDGVEFANLISTNNQGIVALKNGGKAHFENSAFNNCSTSAMEGYIFVGGPSRAIFAGNSAGCDVYIEKNAGRIVAEEGVTGPIAIALNPSTEYADAAVIVEGTTDLKPFVLTDVNRHLEADAENNCLVLKEGTGSVSAIVADESGVAEYFNLQGMRVAQPAAGNVYIVRRGAKVSKMIAK